MWELFSKKIINDILERTLYIHSKLPLKTGHFVWPQGRKSQHISPCEWTVRTLILSWNAWDKHYRFLLPGVFKFTEAKEESSAFQGLGGEWNSRCSLGAEFQFCKMESSVGGWRGRLSNSVPVLMARMLHSRISYGGRFDATYSLYTLKECVCLEMVCQPTWKI